MVTVDTIMLHLKFGHWVGEREGRAGFRLGNFSDRYGELVPGSRTSHTSNQWLVPEGPPISPRLHVFIAAILAQGLIISHLNQYYHRVIAFSPVACWQSHLSFIISPDQSCCHAPPYSPPAQTCERLSGASEARTLAGQETKWMRRDTDPYTNDPMETELAPCRQTYFYNICNKM